MTAEFDLSAPYQDQPWYIAHQKFVAGSEGGKRADLEGAHLEGADLTRANLTRANLKGAHLEGARLAGARLDRCDLKEARLEGADLEGARLEGADLRRANMRVAHLERADLREADLRGADLRDAHLEGADLRGAHLEGANMVLTDLEGARLVGATLPPPPSLLLCDWGSVSPELCRDLMRYDSENHPDPSAFGRWAEGGECPYAVSSWPRAAHFRESRSHWSPLPAGERAPTALSLVMRLFGEKGITL